ncbi:CPBP family intramembrane glutamic endopeptidase [Pseudomonadota bacterium]
MVGIPFTTMIWFRIHQSTGFASTELIIYPLLFGSLGIGGVLLIKSYFLKEPLADFNSGKGSMWSDVLWGIFLTVIYFVLFYIERASLMGLLEFRSNTELLGLMLDMRESPWMVLVWFGPVLWIGIALFEEITRTFLLTTLWSFSSHAVWTAMAIAIAAAIVGLVHWSQGPYGIVTIAIKSIVIGVFYLKHRRLLPLVISHVLYDGLQVGALMLTYPQSQG